MAGDLLGISVTGLKVSQTALSTTGNNIANAGTTGYSRQTVATNTNPSTFQGVGFIGNGANVNAIERQVNEFITEQLRVDTTLFSELDIYYNNLTQLDTLLSDISTGLSGGLESFFAAMQNGSDDPTSIPARQLIQSEAENLADRFNTIYDRFQSIESAVEDNMTAAVAQVNALVVNIAELNRKISDAAGLGNNAQPNDLLDQRDEALRELSSFVSIKTFEQNVGQLNVVVGNGQNLVVGTEARQLALVGSTKDPQKLDVVFQGGQTNQVITQQISGGELGGLIEFRDDIMTDAYNDLGRIAVVMADTFNKTHEQGVNLNNEFGGLFFYDINDSTLARQRVISNSNNTAPNDRQLLLNILDSSALSTSDYEVNIEGGGLYRITRLDDGEQVDSGLLPGIFPFTSQFDGMELTFEAGSFQSGDSFILQPVRTGAKDFSSRLVNPEDIAFGSPILTDASIGNTGAGIISAGKVLSLVDAANNPLPLLQTAGQMNPPLIVHFTSPTTYDILDNSDPGNPVNLVPPLRNQRFVPGISNNLFIEDIGATLVSSNGDFMGLPTGRLPVSQASLQPASPPANAPDFTVSNFSTSTNQFAFDVVVSNTANGTNDGTFTVTINGPAIVDNDTLLTTVNAQLSTSDLRAYIADNGTLAFRLNTPGLGDITLQNYDADPDGGGDNAIAGQANALLGFAIEGSTFTTVANADGYSGDGVLSNGYPAELITISEPATTAGGAPTTQNVFTNLNATAREIASSLNNVAGVSANAFNYVEVTNLQVSLTEPLQVQLNNIDLLEYSVDGVSGNLLLSSVVPDPQVDVNDFYDYLAERINSNTTFNADSIYAVAAVSPVTGQPELRIYSSEGDDLQVGLIAADGETIDVNDGSNSNLSLTGVGNSVASTIVVGGRLDVTLANGLLLSSFPPVSMIFGDTTAAGFANSAYLGIQASINGIPQTGDTFSIDFNQDAARDNRNALALVNLEGTRTIGGGVENYAESYGSLVEKMGIETSSTKINVDASEQVLEQTTGLRNSVSAVNLDEEAANLIRFEQMFSANAQVISVARDLFDRLISSF